MAAWVSPLLAPLGIWFTAVNGTVTEPYLDEVFHIRQSQNYCNGRFDIWDPKITTPPGLYLLSYIASPILGCGLTALRSINAVCLLALFFIVRATYVERRKSHNETGWLSKILAHHSSLNIALFPPLFFFSALYYTDVASTLSVLCFYLYFLRAFPYERITLGRYCGQVLLGAASLTFRQTNIFWVAIAPMGLVLIIELDHGHHVVKESMYRRAEGFGDSTFNVVKTSWKMNVVFDPPVRDARFEDYIRTTVSIVACALKALTQPKRVQTLVLALAPYLTILAIFAAFIFWNGGVVLGDKSNHVATLHLAQMLYLWPYIAFFSWPLLLPHLLIIPLLLISRLSKLSGLEPLIYFRRQHFLPRAHLVVASLLIAVLIVRFNTVVHPFLLADNRHYPFYVFKRLLRPVWLRYMVVPIYVLSGWACIETRGEPPSPSRASPTHQAAVRKAAAYDQEPEPDPSAPSGDHINSEKKRPLRIPDGKSTATVSFVLVSLATTALQLCTAPLVEPRYFIIPWMIWRMHLPLYSTDAEHFRLTSKSKPWRASMGSYDYRIVLETIWFLTINAVTGYVFIHWGFVWPSEPGKVQRFMW